MCIFLQGVACYELNLCLLYFFALYNSTTRLEAPEKFGRSHKYNKLRKKNHPRIDSQVSEHNMDDCAVRMTVGTHNYAIHVNLTDSPTITVGAIFEKWNIDFSKGNIICSGKSVRDPMTLLRTLAPLTGKKTIRMMFIPSPDYQMPLSSDERPPAEPTPRLPDEVGEIHVGLKECLVVIELSVRNPLAKKDYHIQVHDGESSIRHLFQAVSETFRFPVGSFGLIYRGRLLQCDNTEHITKVFTSQSKLLLRFNDSYWRLEEVNKWISDAINRLDTIESNGKISVSLPHNDRALSLRKDVEDLKSMASTADYFGSICPTNDVVEQIVKRIDTLQGNIEKAMIIRR